MSNTLATLTSKLAARLEMGDGSGLIETLKATAFKGQVSDAQMTALIVVANQYWLNPWTKEIYAFPDKNNGIVPVVGVDGWARIINNHPQFDGMDFEQDDKACACIIYRKDRSHPVRVTEYLSECGRNTGPWTSHPKRMLRHKAMIQCARIAFGYGGIYDQDEAERIVEGTDGIGGAASGTTIDGATGEVFGKKEPPLTPPYPADQFEKNLPAWRKAVSEKKKSADEVIAMIQSKGTLTEEQKKKIRGEPGAPPAGDAPMDAADVRAMMDKATNQDDLDAAASMIAGMPESDIPGLQELYRERTEAFN